MNTLIADNAPFNWLPNNNSNNGIFDWLSQPTKDPKIFQAKRSVTDRSTPSTWGWYHRPSSHALYINLSRFSQCSFSHVIWTHVRVRVSVCVSITLLGPLFRLLLRACVSFAFHMGVGQFKICICLDCFWFLADFLFIFVGSTPPPCLSLLYSRCLCPLLSDFLPRPVAFIERLRHKFH